MSHLVYRSKYIWKRTKPFRVKHCQIQKSIMYALYSRVFSFSFFEKRLICIKCEILCKHKVEIYSDTQLIVWLYTWMNSNVANVFNGHWIKCLTYAFKNYKLLHTAWYKIKGCFVHCLNINMLSSFILQEVF